MAPRERATPEAYPYAKSTVVVPTEAEAISDMATSTIFNDYEATDISLVQGPPPGANTYFPSQPFSVPTPTEMPHYSDSLFSIQLPRQPTAGIRHPVLDTPHGEYSGAEGSSSGDTDTPESVIPTVFVTTFKGDPDKPKIVYKENETTANTTTEGTVIAESTMITPRLSEKVVHSQQTDSMKDLGFPQDINLLFVKVKDQNQSGRSDRSF